MTAALLLAAMLTPDSPLLPAERRILLVDRHRDLWVTHGNDLHYVDHATGQPDPTPWDRADVERYYGPLWEAKP